MEQNKAAPIFGYTLFVCLKYFIRRQKQITFVVIGALSATVKPNIHWISEYNKAGRIQGFCESQYLFY